MSDEALERAVDDSLTILQNDATVELKDHLPNGSRDRVRWEQRLWTIVEGPQGERRRAAIRLLAQVATARSVPILLESADDPATHEAVVLGLGRLLQADELSRLAAIEPDAALQQRLFTMLLERRAPEAIEVFLTCVNDRNLHAPALAAVACMSDPPHNQLLPFIEHPQGKLRLAAAQALAELSNPEVARRLSAFAMDGIGRQEAWIALLLSRSAQASNFVNRARGDLYLVASIRAAESQIQSLGTQRGGQVP